MYQFYRLLPVGTTKVSLVLKLPDVNEIFDEIPLKNRLPQREGGKEFYISLQSGKTFPGMLKDIRFGPRSFNHILVSTYLIKEG